MSLPDRMRAFVNDRPDLKEEFYELADNLEVAVETMGAKKILGHWARARRRFCEESCEVLI